MTYCGFKIGLRIVKNTKRTYDAELDKSALFMLEYEKSNINLKKGMEQIVFKIVD